MFVLIISNPPSCGGDEFLVCLHNRPRVVVVRFVMSLLVCVLDWRHRFPAEAFNDESGSIEGVILEHVRA